MISGDSLAVAAWVEAKQRVAPVADCQGWRQGGGGSPIVPDRSWGVNSRSAHALHDWCPRRRRTHAEPRHAQTLKTAPCGVGRTAAVWYPKRSASGSSDMRRACRAVRCRATTIESRAAPAPPLVLCLATKCYNYNPRHSMVYMPYAYIGVVPGGFMGRQNYGSPRRVASGNKMWRDVCSVTSAAWKTTFRSRPHRHAIAGAFTLSDHATR